MTDHRIAATTTWGPDVPCPHCDGRPLIPAPYWTKHLTRHHPEAPMPEPTPAELSAAVSSCPGYETSPNPCRCPCYGCKHHCSAHNPDETAALSWAESVASHGSGPDTAVDIDVNVPGEAEPQPLELPLEAARTLYAMLGDALGEADAAPAPVPPPAGVRDQIAAAIRGCDAAIDFIDGVIGPAEALADAVLRVPAIAEALTAAAAVSRVRHLCASTQNTKQLGYLRKSQDILAALDPQEQPTTPPSA